MSIDRKEKSYPIVCPACKSERFVTYAQFWNIASGHSSGSCPKCGNAENGSKYRFKKGHATHNKGQIGFGKGHPPYFIAKGKDNPFFGKEHSDETKEKMRIAKLGKFGENANRWEGGKVSIANCIRSCDNYKVWRSMVFERDSWTCQTCGARGVSMEAHHIKGFSKILSENNIKTAEDSLVCVELWDISNGVTLCKECHLLTRIRH
jgi:hypothetical protein